MCMSKSMAWEITSPPGVNITIPFLSPFGIPSPFPLPFSSSVAFPLPFSSCVPFPFLVHCTPPCLFTWPLPSWWWFSSPGWVLLSPSDPRSAQFSLSSSSSIISSQFSGRMSSKLPGVYCRQLISWTVPLKSSLPWKEKCSPVRIPCP